MRRRDFIAGLSAVAWPVTAQAQQPAMPLIGWLSSGRPRTTYVLSILRLGLNEMGYVEGRNVAIEARFAEDDYDRLPALAADLVRRQVDVILATTDRSIVAAKAATRTIPIVFTAGNDPVRLGFVAGLNRPSGNLTGVSILSTELVPKRAELLHELIPTATAFGVLLNPGNPNSQTLPRDLQVTARTLGLQLHVLHANAEREFDAAFARAAQLGVSGLMIAPDSMFNNWIDRLGALSVRYAIPTISQFRGFVAAGGLMSYGGSLEEAFRVAGVYIGRILKGEKPADLPVQQLTKVELFINMRTAKALGLTVPLSLLGRADEVIE
jgi:putative ABC transport system substrate-binding protein